MPHPCSERWQPAHQIQGQQVSRAWHARGRAAACWGCAQRLPARCNAPRLRQRRPAHQVKVLTELGILSGALRGHYIALAQGAFSTCHAVPRTPAPTTTPYQRGGSRPGLATAAPNHTLSNNQAQQQQIYNEEIKGSINTCPCRALDGGLTALIPLPPLAQPPLPSPSSPPHLPCHQRTIKVSCLAERIIQVRLGLG